MLMIFLPVPGEHDDSAVNQIGAGIVDMGTVRSSGSWP